MAEEAKGVGGRKVQAGQKPISILIFLKLPLFGQVEYRNLSLYLIVGHKASKRLQADNERR